MTARTTVVVLTLAVAACDGDGSAPPDVAGVVVSGCDDPALWSSPALEQADASFQITDGWCGAQLPLHSAWLGWSPRERAVEQAEAERYDRVCWRVTDASAGSGWTAGQTFMFSTNPSDLADASSMNIIGFARPVTIEGRVLRNDGTIAFATDPLVVQLDEPLVREPEASAVVAVASPDTWVERDALHMRGARVATDEVLDVASNVFNDATVTLHRVGANLVWRRWSYDDGQFQHSDFVLGPGTRGRLGPAGNPVIVDNEVLVLDQDASHNLYVARRVPLGAEPLEVADFGGYMIIHLPGSLILIGNSEDPTMAVGDGVLLSAIFPEPPRYFDGTAFHMLDWNIHQLAFGPTFTPRPEDLAMLGKPIGDLAGVVVGEHGFLSINSVLPVGPRFASFADVFGDGELGPVSVSKPAYVIEHVDGRAELYDPPGEGFCSLE